ncbi:MAG: (d)CMP kinase [Corticimicrobacter sp.]|uniref:(d)CMP kinase n=1 Tax=Corticimicrobacter sp. TaxID=2678536 RepID=UPI0032DA4639
MSPNDLSNDIPVIAIDGPTASGKGTVAAGVAQALGWHILDSGAIYRLAALASMRREVAADDEAALAALAGHLDIRFDADGAWLDGECVADAIRQEAVGVRASVIAALPEVRAALLARQRQFRQMPGLVADGRDMGTVVFPGATLKVFLVAAAQARAERRYKQLKAKGISANLEDLLRDLMERDARDTGRKAAPLVPAPDSVTLDSSAMTAVEVIAHVLSLYRARITAAV